MGEESIVENKVSADSDVSIRKAEGSTDKENKENVVLQSEDLHQQNKKEDNKKEVSDSLASDRLTKASQDINNKKFLLSTQEHQTIPTTSRPTVSGSEHERNKQNYESDSLYTDPKRRNARKNDRGAGRYYRFRTDRIAQQNLVIDYKRPDILKMFLTDQGKILPRRFTGNSAKNQKRLVKQAKIARVLALLPFYTR